MDTQRLTRASVRSVALFEGAKGALVLLVGFGLTRSVATLGVLAWRLVNFWLPIPTGAIAYVTLKVPRGADLRATRRAIAEIFTRSSPAGQQPAEEAAEEAAQEPAEEAPVQDRS